MLTNNDIDTLIDALDALQSKESSSAFTSVLLSGMLSKSEDKENWKAEAEKTMENARQKERGLAETVILLKAKLIGMRDRALVEEMSAQLRDG